MKRDITTDSNDFFDYLCSYTWFSEERLKALKHYIISTTKHGNPIFWHANTTRKITNGHILTMNANSGKVYDSSWYFHDGQPIPLFGEHLLNASPDKPVALVKGEITACVMSCFATPYLWLATGGTEVTRNTLAALNGRIVVVFPDKGDYCEWQQLAANTTNIKIHISDVLERCKGNYSTIAEVLLSQQPLRQTREQMALEKMKGSNPAIAKLIDALQLEVVSVKSPEEADSTSMTKGKSRFKEKNAEGKSVASSAKINAKDESRWNGRNKACHGCKFSHEGINGTNCDKLGRYVEYGRGDCSKDGSPPL